jgi:hypothetical protein
MINQSRFLSINHQSSVSSVLDQVKDQIDAVEHDDMLIDEVVS